MVNILLSGRFRAIVFCVLAIAVMITYERKYHIMVMRFGKLYFSLCLLATVVICGFWFLVSRS